ncbi:MAG: FtsW/RodA/SpoVE family cell cycle protein, partial [Lachnospiraceae bacterium]|nr:FtsW/RodA/SpoVE family cell cycle protein [Lachnospiraceae bacterium]
HVQVRVQAWKDPFSCIDDAGYQITQSLFAISSGGWFGLGLFRGTPDSIPFVEADFVFSAVAEELGIAFSMCMILICISCFIMFMNIAMRLQDKFYQLIAFGLGVTYIFQVFLTIGGGTKFIPMTGITLPFISYGGSSVLTTLVMFFIIEGLYIIRQEEGTKRAKKKRRRRTQPEDFREGPETEEEE